MSRQLRGTKLNMGCHGCPDEESHPPPRYFTVTFVLNGGAFNGSPNNLKIQVERGGQVFPPTITAPLGMTHLGWNPVGGMTVIDSDREFVAVFGSASVGIVANQINRWRWVDENWDFIPGLDGIIANPGCTNPVNFVDSVASFGTQITAEVQQSGGTSILQRGCITPPSGWMTNVTNFTRGVIIRRQGASLLFVDVEITADTTGEVRYNREFSRITPQGQIVHYIDIMIRPI